MGMRQAMRPLQKAVSVRKKLSGQIFSPSKRRLMRVCINSSAWFVCKLGIFYLKKNKYLLWCRDLGYLKTNYTGNLTTMCRHCTREGVGHYRIYVQQCLVGNVPMHDRCMLDSIRNKLDDKGWVCYLILSLLKTVAIAAPTCNRPWTITTWRGPFHGHKRNLWWS